MSHFIHTHSARVAGANGTTYAAHVIGEPRDDGTWAGWIEFRPEPPSSGAVLRTDRETTQPDRRALEYWAGGLEPVYLEGALTRAKP